MQLRHEALGAAATIVGPPLAHRKWNRFGIVIRQRAEFRPHRLAREIDSLNFHGAPFERGIGRMDQDMIDTSDIFDVLFPISGAL